MINIDYSSLVNTSSCLFFFLRALRDALNVYDQLKSLTSNERAGSSTCLEIVIMIPKRICYLHINKGNNKEKHT